MTWTQAYGGQAAKRGDLNGNCLLRLLCLNTWSLVNGTVCEGLEGGLFSGRYVAGVDFEVSRLEPLPVCALLPACVSRYEPSALSASTPLLYYHGLQTL